MRLVTIIAIGGKEWGNFALNCCLSIKAHNWKQKVALITDGHATLGLESEIEKFFDYQTLVAHPQYPTPQEKSFYTKVNLYDIVTAMCPDANEFINIDADCLMIPGRSVDEWFNQHEGRTFTCWNNDLFDFKTGTTSRKDYTFWCNPLEAKEKYGLENPMPQVNTSFIYFNKSALAKNLFEVAKKVWHDTDLEYKEYKGVKPDELCFNIACSVTNVLPHETPYYPIFFQFASSNQQELYIQHCYPALGFAGQLRPSDRFVDLYNKYADYYRDLFGVGKFTVDTKVKAIKDYGEIILPCVKRTIFRAGELPNSDGGVFNPSAIVVNGELITILRKEKNLDCYKKYTHSTAIPHIITEYRDFELPIEGVTNARREDFRLFNSGSGIMVSYTKIVNGECSIAFGLLGAFNEALIGEVDVILPIEKKPMEKNWAFFESDQTLYCIYSLNPYRLFKLDTDWKEVSVKQPKLKWFHSEYICNSSHPILIDNYYLMLFHTKELGVYFTGAVLLDKTKKEIVHYTKNSIRLKDYADGLNKGLIYASGCVYLEDKNAIRILYGEGDSSACYSDFNKDELINAIINNHA